MALEFPPFVWEICNNSAVAELDFFEGDFAEVSTPPGQ